MSPYLEWSLHITAPLWEVMLHRALFVRPAVPSLTIKYYDNSWDFRWLMPNLPPSHATGCRFRQPAVPLVTIKFASSLLWRHNGRHGVSNHQPHNCLLDCLFRRRSKKTSKLCVTGFCVGNSPVTSEFPAQMASNAENVSIRWRHLAWRLSAG